MDKNSIPLEEKFSFSSQNQNENESNIKNEIIINSKKKEKNVQKKTKKINKISIKPQKRKRPHSPTMDIEEEDNNNINIIKKKKLPLIKLVERINLNDTESAPLKNFENKIKFAKKKRGVKIFSDMSVSEISNNLFKNYYPCVLPDYYQDQISEQIIQNQLDKLISNFITEKKDEIKNKTNKINQNMDYLRQLAKKQGEWVDYYDENVDDKYQENEEEEKGYKSYDSNSENNSINSYPEDESVEQEDYEQDFGDKYDDYENDDYQNENDEY